MPAAYAFLDAPLPLAFAHRGGAVRDDSAAENTLAAFEQAVRLGYRYLETDVHATADGQLVVFHDDSLQRLTGDRRLICDLRWAELASIELPGGGRVPLLADLLGSWPDIRLNIDVKGWPAVPATVATLRRTRAIDRVCVASFDDRRIAAVRRELGPTLCTSLGRRGVAALRLVSLGLPARLPDAGCAQIPRRVGVVRLLDRRLLRTAHRAGLQVHIWTLDEPSDITAVLDLGADGVMTDRPAVLRDTLTRRGQWHGSGA